MLERTASPLLSEGRAARKAAKQEPQSCRQQSERPLPRRLRWRDGAHVHSPSPVSGCSSLNGNSQFCPYRGDTLSNFSIKSAYVELSFIIATTAPKCSLSFG